MKMFTLPLPEKLHDRQSRRVKLFTFQLSVLEKSCMIATQGTSPGHLQDGNLCRLSYYFSFSMYHGLKRSSMQTRQETPHTFRLNRALRERNRKTDAASLFRRLWKSDAMRRYGGSEGGGGG